MYTVSDLFKTYVIDAGREFETKAMVGSITYDNSSVIEFTITDSLIPSEELTIGTVIASKLTLRLKTTDVILSGAKIQPFVRLNGISGYTEWVPLGSYYVDVPKYQNGVWQISGLDALVTAQKPYAPTVTFPCTMQVMFDDICTQLGFIKDSSAVINPWWMMSVAPDPTFNMRDWLGFLASTMTANVRMTKDNKIGFVTITPPTARTAIGPSDYFKAEKTNPTKTYNGIIAAYTSDGKTISEGTVTDLNTVMNFKNPLMIHTILGDVLETLNGFQYTPFTMEWKGRPDLEVGDGITLTLRDGSVINSTILTNVMSFKGGLKSTSSAPAYSPQRSESDYTGSMQPTIKRNIEMSVVKSSDDTVFKHDEANGVKVKNNQADFNFTDDNGGQIPNVRPDGFYLGDTKFESGSGAISAFTNLTINFLEDNTGFQLIRDGVSETWIWTKDAVNRINLLTTSTARTVNITYP